MMKVEDLLFYKDKKIKITLKNRYCYTCFIKKFLENSIQIVDKYENLVTISAEDISIVTELKGVKSEDDVCNQ